MFEKEKQKLVTPIKNLLTSKILSGDIKFHEDREINKIEELGILLINIDEEKSDLRKNIIISEIFSTARIIELWNDGTQSSLDIKIELNKPLVVNYNYDMDGYEVLNEKEVSIRAHTS
ncbi:hypothetical protein [Chryseobacterium sediminis]|uniref:hypothetical protein n=1 Tax=Chryseobacterium sediminis TaxID=1679494 RepID=UPI00285B7E7B|nr:hypothetical protein [Chryseobacterium sediminis]MDR6465162.1 hypothetical protein [Chryseobacterium sediminis]